MNEHTKLGGMACHPELVEGSREKAQPTMLRQAQHDPLFNYIMRICEALTFY
jgi:hypothetical protein